MYDGEADVAWKVGRIMLRFRPIAPRPSCAAAAGSPVVSTATLEPCAPTRRPKRKGLANLSSENGGRRRKAKKVETTATAVSRLSSKEDEKLSSSSSTSSSVIVTLPLMPETSERWERPEQWTKLSSNPITSPAAIAPAWMRRAKGEGAGEIDAGLVIAAPTVWAMRSWVTVESVTDTWGEGEVAWRSDEAVRAALAADECPGFISDVWSRVTWTNEAYRRLVVGSSFDTAGRGKEEEEEVTTGLVTQGLVTAACRAFTCNVHVSYLRRGKSSSLLAAPCDVWRLDDDGFAWLLDVKAALSLSL
ncbi:hypothetical protein Cni_G09962 [Canna indica]|uniref:DUF7950 domain-containing protein n=1 Tax=Canna indica TaxID=4628 RepID=A0AAQ3Q9G1_9LILI|nr:hypothetical protein Cni_G09962 [Canna indica]